jgi:hypothetical protein
VLAEQAALEQRLGDRDADHAGQVVVAHPGGTAIPCHHKVTHRFVRPN